MTQLAIIEPELDYFTEEEATSLKVEIDSLLDSIHGQEKSLATNYVHLGKKMLRVQQGQYWREWGYPSVAAYYQSVGARIGRQRAQMYNYVSVAEKLLPYVSEQDLEAMGISRAQELARFVKQTGRIVTPHLLEAALDPNKNIAELHAEVMQAANAKGEVRGSWWEPFGGSYYDLDERKEVQMAVQIAMKDVDPTHPEHIQRKHVILALVREFISSNPQ